MTENSSNEFTGDLHDGELVAGRYEILRLLGAGGMGAVYLVNDRVLGGDPVAMKVLHRQFVADPKYSQRFLREVQLMRRVNHRNVVRTYDVGADGDLMYFTMEYVPGISLIEWASGHSVARDTLLSLLKQICTGLKAIHDAGIVHRDLKPDNIIIIGDGSIKITDFGVARPENSQLTQHNEIIGSANYMAPEVWLGEPVTPAVDLYALGVVLYELATGQLPFEAETPAAMMRLHLDRIPTPPKTVNPGVPIWLNRLVLSLLEKRAHQRFKSADEVMNFLEQVESRERPQPKDVKVHSESVSLLSQLEAQSKRSTSSRTSDQTRHGSRTTQVSSWHTIFPWLLNKSSRFTLVRQARTLADYRPQDTLLNYGAIFIGVILLSALPAGLGHFSIDQLGLGETISTDNRWASILSWLETQQGLNNFEWYLPLLTLFAATGPLLLISYLCRTAGGLFRSIGRTIAAVVAVLILTAGYQIWMLSLADNLSGEITVVWKLWRDVLLFCSEMLLLSPWHHRWQNPLTPAPVFANLQLFLLFFGAVWLAAWVIFVPRISRNGSTGEKTGMKRAIWSIAATLSTLMQIAWFKNQPPLHGAQIGPLEICLPFVTNWIILGALAYALTRSGDHTSKR